MHEYSFAEGIIVKNFRIQERFDAQRIKIDQDFPMFWLVHIDIYHW